MPPGATPVAATTTPPAAPSRRRRLPRGRSAVTMQRRSASRPSRRLADPSVVIITTVRNGGARCPPSRTGAARSQTQGLGTGFVIDKVGRHPHEQPRRRGGATADRGEAVGRARVPGEGRRPGSADRHRRRPHRREGPARAAARATRTPSRSATGWSPSATPSASRTPSAPASSAPRAARRRTCRSTRPATTTSSRPTRPSTPATPAGRCSTCGARSSGINSAIRGGGAQGIGFAIPINMVKQLLPMLLRDGHVTRSALGRRHHRRARAGAGRAESREARGHRGRERRGHRVVSPGGPARQGRASCRATSSWRSTAPPSTARRAAPVARQHAGVGQTVTLRVQREGKQFDQKVTLGPAAGAAPRRGRSSLGARNSYYRRARAGPTPPARRASDGETPRQHRSVSSAPPRRPPYPL